jgi:hypothetical protein
MNKIFNYFLLILIPILFTSCATTVKFSIEHQPPVDMHSMETITVIPLEWRNNGNHSYLASSVTKALIAGVKKTKVYKFIDPATLKDVNEMDYWKYVDVYIDAAIIDVITHEKEINETEKDSDGNSKKTISSVRTVAVRIEYEYVRATDYKVLGIFDKVAHHSSSAQTYDSSDNLAGNIFNAIFAPLFRMPTEMLARTAVRDFSSRMSNEFTPYTTMEVRAIAESKNKNPMFNEAKKLVKQKKYSEAMTIYKNLYEQTGSVVAGYNMAILLAVNKQYNEALMVLTELYNKLSKMDAEIPPFMEKDIELLRSMINEPEEQEGEL